MSKITKDLFTDKAEAYAQYRPTYPEEAINIILNKWEGDQSYQAVDVGAGTGISSILLAERGVQVTAVEPNKSMIESGECHPNLKYLQASAEQIPIQSSSVDLITSFQSFHWFDFKSSLWEFKRILKNNGRLCILWNYWDESDHFTKKYMGLINNAVEKNEQKVSPYGGLKGKIEHIRTKLLWKFRFLPYFKNVQRHQLQHIQLMGEEDLIGTARSQSNIQHKGPLWDQLVEQIRNLTRDATNSRLVHDINLFTCRPR